MGSESVSVGPENTVWQFKCVARTVRLCPADGPQNIKENFQKRLQLSWVDIMYSGRSTQSQRTVRLAGLVRLQKSANVVSIMAVGFYKKIA